MDRTPLSEYVDLHGQTETARRAGLTQGSIWQMLKSERRIFVIEHDDGSISLEEHKQLARRSAA
jgi:hypothetical protein